MSLRSNQLHELLPVSAERFDCTDEYADVVDSAAAAEKGRVSFSLSLALLVSTGRLDELRKAIDRSAETPLIEPT